MKAIILSAGQGSRLGHLVDNGPKCLIDFNGRTLLDRQLDTLAANGVDEAVVVTGFRDDTIEAALATRGGGPKVRTVYNPFYKVADNLGSLYVAKHEIEGECLVWNGDTLVSDALMARVLGNDRQGIAVTIDRKDSYDADDMKVQVEGTRLLDIGKTLPLDLVNGESIGMLLFRGTGPRLFCDAVERAMRQPEGLKWWYLKVIAQIAKVDEVQTALIQGLSWGEVDYPADLIRAERLAEAWERRS